MSKADLNDGVYAEMNTTKGTILLQLEFEKTPFTVANFVGLAEGTKTWVEEGTGRLRNEPYYDGQIVIRIADIPSAIVQTGSQNETNSGGGPGYTFRDEFHPSLRHDGFGMLSFEQLIATISSCTYHTTTRFHKNTMWIPYRKIQIFKNTTFLVYLHSKCF